MVALAAALRDAFGARLVGLYVHGSIALEDFDPASSDVDFIAVVAGEIDRADRGRIRSLHERLARSAVEARRFEGMYLTDEDCARPDFLRPHPYVKRGRLRRRGHRVGPTARFIVREHGVVVDGPPPADVFPRVSRDEIRAEMAFNLDVYWAGRARRPYLFLSDTLVDFAVLTIPRILHTLETGTMISKRRAADYLDARFPEWETLVRDVRGRFQGGRSPRLLSRPRRAVMARRFIREMIRYARATHGLAGEGSDR